MPQSRSWLDSERSLDVGYDPPYVAFDVGSQENLIPLPVSLAVNVGHQLHSYEDADGLMQQQQQQQSGDGGVEMEEGRAEAEAEAAGRFKSLDCISSAGEKSEEDRAFKQGAWSVAESKVLFFAKKQEKESLSGLNRKSTTADDRWKAIAEFCWSRGVERSKDQCKFKWENWLPEFRKVRAFQKEKSSEIKSYFEMEKCERRSCHLPQNIDQELYCIVDSILDGKSMAGSETRPNRVVGEGSVANRADKLTIDLMDGHSNGEKSERAEGAKAWCDSLRKRDRADLDDALKILQMQNPAKDAVDEDATFRVVQSNSLPNSKTRKRDGENFSIDERSSELLLQLEDRKDARHREIVSVERENLAAIASVASALNNVASAFQKLTELFLQH